MGKLDVAVRRLPHACADPLDYQTADASGVDLTAAVETSVIIPSGGTALLPTGIRLAIPPGYEGQVRPRSGLALKHGVTVLNSPGTIDADYRGEIRIILINHGGGPFTVERGMRIAQLVFAPVVRAVFTVDLDWSDTPRGDGGFGHTGT